MQVSLQLNPDIIAQVDKELAGLGMLSRMPAIKKGLRNAGNVVRKRVQETLPKPGYPGDKPGLKPLRDTVATKVKEYPTGAVVAIVGTIISVKGDGAWCGRYAVWKRYWICRRTV
jgi:hypothetical protein